MPERSLSPERIAFRRIHPATSLAGFFFFAASLPALSDALLAAALAFALLSAAVLARSNAWALLRRCRFLILALCILHAWFTPGEALWGGAWAALSPSREGGVLALEHLARLLALLSVLAVLLEKLGSSELIAGTLPLLAPLHLIGIAPARAALRLALVLDLLERRDAVRGWREWVGLAEQGQAELRAVQLVVPAWKLKDGGLILLFALVCAGVWSLAR